MEEQVTINGPIIVIDTDAMANFFYTKVRQACLESGLTDDKTEEILARLVDTAQPEA